VCGVVLIVEEYFSVSHRQSHISAPKYGEVIRYAKSMVDKREWDKTLWDAMVGADSVFERFSNQEQFGNKYGNKNNEEDEEEEDEEEGNDEEEEEEEETDEEDQGCVIC
jgi:cobalamin biosynthesis protein CobT